jgi:hypothetical protein
MQLTLIFFSFFDDDSFKIEASIESQFLRLLMCFYLGVQGGMHV